MVLNKSMQCSMLWVSLMVFVPALSHANFIHLSLAHAIEQGLINTSDLLSVEGEQANASQKRIKTHADVPLARSLLTQHYE